MKQRTSAASQTRETQDEEAGHIGTAALKLVLF